MRRELTRDERRAIRRLVTSLCANYDRTEGLCLPLDCPCYMLNKWWTGGFCRYFEAAVLPVNSVLAAAVTGKGAAPDTRLCAVCGRAFLPAGKQAYCSVICAEAARRKRQREYMRKRRVGR